MATVNLTNQSQNIITGKDNVVIVDNFQSIRGGRSLDVTGFAPDVINAGHIIIHHTATNEYKPMPVTGTGAIEGLGSITGGSAYTDGTYNGVALTGGSGTGATANITVSGGAVTDVFVVQKGASYVVGDTLSATAGTIGGTGTGFSIPVGVVNTEAAAYAALPSGHTYAGILIATIMTNKPSAAIMVRGTVNPAAAPFPMTNILSAVKTALHLIDFRQD